MSMFDSMMGLPSMGLPQIGYKRRKRKLSRVRSLQKRCCNCHQLYDPANFHNCPHCREDVPYYVRVYNR